MRKLASFCMLFWAQIVFGQTVAPGGVVINAYERIDFNFSNPGARTLGMGGAFAAYGDDATAAYSNPAGLANLIGSSVVAEVRRDESTLTTVSCQPPFCESLDVLEGQEFQSSTIKPVFAAYARPLTDRLVGALFWHKTIDTEVEAIRERIYPNRSSDPPIVQRDRETNRFDYNLNGIGISIGFAIKPGTSIGGSVVLYDLNFQSQYLGETVRTQEDGSELSFSSKERLAIAEEDHVLGGSIGILQQVGLNWTIGAYYRFLPSAKQIATREESLRREGLQHKEFHILGTSQIKVPDVLGVGISRATENWMILAELSWVRYSQFLSDDVAIDILDRGRWRYDDALEARFGVERVWPGGWRPALRLGFWWEGNHDLYFEPSSQDIDSLTKEQRSFQKSSSSEFHLTGGFGIRVGRATFLDLGIDYSEKTQRISVSAVHWF